MDVLRCAQGRHQAPVQAGPQLFGIGEISKQQDGSLQPSAPEFQAFSECGNTESAVVAGVNLQLHATSLVALGSLNALAPDGQCKKI